MGLFDNKNVTKPVIPGYLKDDLKNITNDIGSLYDKGKGGKGYTGSLVTPFHSSTTDAFGYSYDANGNLVQNGGGMLGLAGANTDGKGMAPHLQAIMDQGGFTADQLASMDRMKTMIDNPGLAELINGNGLTGDQNVAFDKLKGTVYGNNDTLQKTFDQGGLTDDQLSVADFYRGDMNEAFDPETIPGYSQVRSRTLDAGANSVAAQMAKMGRLGGAANQGILARTQMDQAAAMDNAEYDKWRSRRTAGASGLAALSEAGKNSQLAINAAQQAGLGAVSDMGQRGVDNRNSAIALKSDMNNNLFNAQASGLDRVGQAYATAMQPFQTQRAVGAEFEDLMSRQLADQKRIHDESDPLKRKMAFLSALSGQPVGQTTTSSPSLASLIAAGGLTALTLPTLMNFGGAGGATGGVAA